MIKNGIVDLILLFCVITLINSEIEISQINDILLKSYNETEVPEKIDYYVTDLRIGKKTIKSYKINIDESFTKNVWSKKIRVKLAEKK